MAVETQVTFATHGHVLTNVAVWSADSQWLVYDTRSDPAGSEFDGDRIERVNVRTKEVQRLYTSKNGAHCGVVTWHPSEEMVAFILGPEHPTADWSYGPSRRRGVIVDLHKPRDVMNLDARDLMPPFTPGALRGGSHVHVFSPDGGRVSFTYNDQIVRSEERNVGVAAARFVKAPPTHPRNHDGEFFSVLVTRTVARPAPGSDEIRRAFEDAWVGDRAIAFQGEVITSQGAAISELFIVELPDDLTAAGTGPLQGSTTALPQPAAGVVQRRLTRTAGRKYPGLAASPRHWVRSSPDGSRIAFLMRDDHGLVQLWTIAPSGGEPRQLTRNAHSISSAFTWSPDAKQIAHAMDNSVCLTDVATGKTTRLTARSSDADAPRPEAVVFSPDGGHVAYVRNVESGAGRWNQIFIARTLGP
jgi:WD40 repeat protein